MKKLFLLLFIISTNVYGQLEGYKYVNVETAKYETGPDDKFGLYDAYSDALRKKGFIPIPSNQISNVIKKGKYCQLLRVLIDNVVSGQVSTKGVPYESVRTTLAFVNCKNETVSLITANYSTFYGASVNGMMQKSGKRAISKLKKNIYNPILTPKFKKLGFDFSKIDLELDGKSEKSIRTYFDLNGVNNIEGIWGLTSDGKSYRLAVFYSEYKYYVTVIESIGLWLPGELIGEMEESAADEFLTIKWYDKTDELITNGIVDNNALITFGLGDEDFMMYKIYPKIVKDKKPKVKSGGEWAGNGSGIIISKSGYIITNHHVIEDAENIEVEFIIDGEVKKFNAELIQSDKVNDLAVIKIFDMNFDGLDNLPYNFKTRSSDVGTKVYAYGYPMALSVMGKEIKITDGIISSKSGYDGNITTYQITAPIQGGNSGGPLFDDKGNFIGINSSGLSKDFADNVGYTIKSSYVLNLIDVLPKSIDLPSSTKLQSLPLTEQIKEISKYVVLVKVK